MIKSFDLNQIRIMRKYNWIYFLKIIWILLPTRNKSIILLHSPHQKNICSKFDMQVFVTLLSHLPRNSTFIYVNNSSIMSVCYMLLRREILRQNEQRAISSVSNKKSFLYASIWPHKWRRGSFFWVYFRIFTIFQIYEILGNQLKM